MIEEMRSDNKKPDLNDIEVSAPSTRTHWFSHVTESPILFLVIAVFVFAAIWGTTLSLIRTERAAAEHTAKMLTHQLSETYQSQAVRALREIDRTLKIVQYAHDVRDEQAILQKLQARSLLPSPLLFDISIVNAKGNVVASTDPAAVNNNVADQYIFQSQRKADHFSVSRPQRNSASGVWKLDFSRRLDTPNGDFAGIVMLSVDAAYFVSSYESAQLGQHGMLGLLGTDGIFRVRRSGDTISAGKRINLSSMAMSPILGNEATRKIARGSIALINPWDGVQRYTTAHKLYGFPLIAIVGLSVNEQLASAQHRQQVYLWRAAAGSFIMFLIIAVFWRMSRQLVLGRQRALEEHIAHAARVEHIAYHDGLTTLPNRSLFSKLLSYSINQAQRYNRKLAVLFFDLDNFKKVNDTLGHDAGDQLLQEVATRVKACMRESDTVARIGGDEFVALLPELDDEKYIATVAQKILAAVDLPFILQGKEVYVTASIGISIYPQDGLDEETLQKNADIAMYQVKVDGRNNFQFYS